MDEKAINVLIHLKLTLTLKQSEIERIRQYLTVLLTCGEANLFSKTCVATLLKDIQQILLDLQEPPFSLSRNVLRRELNQALLLAKKYQLSDAEKVLRRLQPTSSAIEYRNSLLERESEESDLSRQNSIKNFSYPNILWHHHYIKPLFQLYEYQLSEKKTAFPFLLQKILPTFISVLEKPEAQLDVAMRKNLSIEIEQIANEHHLNDISSRCATLKMHSESTTDSKVNFDGQAYQIVFDLLQILKNESFSKKEAQNLLLLTKNVSQICLSNNENDNAYALLEKAIILADQFNLATYKVNLVLLQGSVFNTQDNNALTYSTKLSPEKSQESLKNYFDALPEAEANEDDSEFNELSRAITLLEKKFLYQTIQPWIAKYMGQTVESGAKENTKLVFERFKSLVRSLMECNLSNLAFECLIELQSGLTPSMSDLHGELLNEFYLFSTRFLSEDTTTKTSNPLSGEWQRYRRQISSYRKILQRGISKPLQFSQSQQAFTENMQGLAAQFLRECEGWLGKPPEPYCLLGLGSISRKMSPYSDLECVFLVSDANSADWEGQATDAASYFDALYQLFEFKMASLGELCGFHLDTEGHARKELRLRGTTKIIIRQSMPPQASIDSEMTYSLLQPCFIHGDKILWEQYQTEWNMALQESVSTKETTPWGILIAKNFLKRHKKYLDEQLKISTNTSSNEVNIKTRYVSPLFYLMSDIGFYHQLFFSDPITILDRLVSQKKLSPIWANAYREAIQWADKIRVRLHLHYGEQEDIAFLDTKNSDKDKFIPLTSQEKAYLNLIDTAIFKPMQHALTRLEAGYTDAILNPIQDLLDLTLLKLPENQVEFSQTHKETIESSIATLILADVNADTYRLFYLSLRTTSIRNFFCKQLDQFQSYYSKDKWQLIQSNLNDVPYYDGRRDKQEKELAQWESQISHLVLAQHKNNLDSLQLFWIQNDGKKQGGALNPIVIEALKNKKLLDSKNKLELLEKHIDLPGRHLVVRLSLQIDKQAIEVHLKFFPEMPGMEYAAGRLAHLLVGWGAPYVQLAYLTDGKKKYPVLLSQTIEGILLSDLLKTTDANQLHKKLNAKYYSQRFLLSLLLGQEDGKPSNYIAASSSLTPTPSYEIVCIDNDHTFAKAVLEERGEVVVGIKDIIFCFETMKDSLDMGVQLDVLSLNAYALLQLWLSNLEKFNHHLEQLFSNEDIEKVFPKNQPTQRLQQKVREKIGEKEAIKESVLPIVLPEHMASDLYVKLTRIQAYLQHHVRPTHYQLLQHVEPYLAWYYGNLLSEYPDIHTRFHHGFSKLYSDKKDKSGGQQTLKTGFATLQTLHGKPIDLKEFLERKEYSIENAQKELAVTIDREHASKSVYEQLQSSKEEGLTGLETLPDNYLRAKIINRLAFKVIDASFEKLVWETVIRLKIPFQKLSLNNSTINLIEFKAVLRASPELRILEIENCENLNDDFIGIVAECCPILEKLSLCKLPIKILNNRESFMRQLLTPLNSKPVSVFKKLLYLAVKNCDVLNELYVKAPSITHLELINCPQLAKGSFNSEQLKSIKIVGCSGITQSNLSELLPYTKALKHFQVEKCPQLTHLDFYQSFPYLLSLDISGFTDIWLSQFTQILKPYTPEKINTAKKSSLFHALKIYFSQIHRLKDIFIEQLKEESIDVNLTAIVMLEELGCIDEKVIDALKIRLKTASPTVEQAIKITLSTLEPSKTQTTLPQKALSNPNDTTEKTSDKEKTQSPLITTNAAYILPSELLKQVKHQNWQERKSAILQIRELKIDNKAIRSILYEASKDSSDQVRQLAVEILTHFNASDPLMTSIFLQALQDKNWRIRETAIFALGEHHSEVNKDILQAIETAMGNNSDSNMRKTFAMTLGKLHQSIPDVFERLLLLIQSDPYNDVKRAAMESSIKWISHRQLQLHLETLNTTPIDNTLETNAFVENERFSWMYIALAICLARASTNKHALRLDSKSNFSFFFHDVIITIFKQLNLDSESPTFSTHFVNRYFAIAQSRSNKALFWKPTYLPDKKGVLASNQPSSTLKALSAPNALIFPEKFNYLDVLRGFRKTISTFIDGNSTQLENALASELIENAKTPLTKIILIEAFEFMAIKLSSQEKMLQKSRETNALIQKMTHLDKKIKNDLNPLFTNLQLFLQDQLTQCTDQEMRQKIQQANAALFILKAENLEQKNQGKNWNEKTFLKKITTQELADIKLANKKVTMKEIWKIVDDFFQAYFPLSELQSEEKKLSKIYNEKMQRYKRLLNAFKIKTSTSISIAPLGNGDQFLKNNASSKNPWKQTWLYNQAPPIQRCGGKQGLSITSFFHLGETFRKERCMFYENFEKEMSVLLGSTYFGAEKPKSLETTLCMDANYQQGDTGATSDGYGHFSDMEQNRNVQTTAYRTVKFAVRYADLYLNAQAFYDELPVLFNHLGQAIKQSFLHPEEAGTASCVLTKVFADASNPNLFTVVAAGVGDGMAIAWNPLNCTLLTLVSPRQYDRGPQFTPMSITEKLKGNMLQSTLVKVPKGTLILRLTDGAWQSLPHCIKKMLDTKSNTHYLEYTLDESTFLMRLTSFAKQNSSATTQDYRGYLLGLIQQSIFNKKSFLIKETQMIREKLDRFSPKRSGSVQNFIHWIEQNDKNYYPTILKFLDAINVSLEQVKNAPITDFEDQLNKINLGDDIALHIECVGGTTNSAIPRADEVKVGLS